MEQAEFEARVLALTQPLYRVASALLRRDADRQDAVQSCVLRAWEKRAQLRDAEKFKPWLLRILVNCCHSLLRRVRGEVLCAQTPPAACPLRDDALRDALDALSPALRVVIVLKYLEGMDVKEIAYALRLPAGTVKSRLARGREALRLILKEEVE